MKLLSRSYVRSGLASAAALFFVLVAASCGGGGSEPSQSEMKKSAQATVEDYLSAVRQGNYKKACSLLVYDDGSSLTGGALASCKKVLPGKPASAVRDARVDKVIAIVQEGDPVAQVLPGKTNEYRLRTFPEKSIVVSIKNAPEARDNPRYGAPVFTTLGPGLEDGCGRDWCIVPPVPGL